MRMRMAAVLTLAGALAVGTAVPAAAAPGAGTALATWSPPLAGGEAAGVVVDGGTARLAPSGTHLTPDGSAPPVPTGLLTLAPHRLPAPTDRVDTAVSGEVPRGATATVDVRGRRADGRWTEWVPAGPDGSAALPDAVAQVQGRLVLTGEPEAGPAVERVTLTAHPAAPRRLSDPAAERLPLTYRVFATREGLVGGTTANGHVIVERDHFVALPSRRALSPRGTSDYAVRICVPEGRCAFAPVWDVGPWNTRDDYWNPPDRRQEWADLPQGVPQAQAAFEAGYHGGRDQFGREVRNPAGIDLGDGLFWDALGLTDNAWVTVDYLWTGSVRLSLVEADAPVEVRAAPALDAEVVGIAAVRSAVPVECVLGAGPDRWLRIGADQFVPAVAVPSPGPVGICADDPAPPLGAGAVDDAVTADVAADVAAATTGLDTDGTDTTG